MPNTQSNPLLAISPLDGRYQNKCDDLAPYFSEFGLMRYRVLVEVKWLQKLAATAAIKELGEIDSADIESLNSLYADFSLDDAQKIKDIVTQTIQLRLKAFRGVLDTPAIVKERWDTYKTQLTRLPDSLQEGGAPRRSEAWDQKMKDRHQLVIVVG